MTLGNDLHCCRARYDDRDAWNQLVNSIEDANLAQRFEWRSILRRLELPSEFIMVEDSSGLLGCISFRIAQEEGSISLLSPPNYCDGGPAITQRSEEVLDATIKYLRSIHPSISKVIIRSTKNNHLPGLKQSGKCNMVLQIKDVYKDTIRSFSSSTRRKIRRSGEDTRILTLDACGVDDFYQLYEKTMLEKGAWTKSTPFFKEMFRHFVNNPYLHLSLAEYKGDFIAGLIYSIYKKTMILLYSGWDRDYSEINANYALIGRAIEQAHEFNCRKINFGLTPLDEKDGLYQFKARWGAKPKPINLLKKRYGTGSFITELASKTKSFFHTRI